MKKIDLHIHTVATPQDAPFEFSLDTLKRYVDSRELDAIAITNHNVFDLKQFREILHALSGIDVFPGIEVDLEGGHLLLIASPSEVEEFAIRSKEVTERIETIETQFQVSDLVDICRDLSRYLLIPHYAKKPVVGLKTLQKLGSHVVTGEVTSPKKFKHCLRDGDALVPVIFSDTRMAADTSDFSLRQTYIDAGETTFAALRFCLGDKNKVFLSRRDGHHLFDALPNGVRLSTGLNVVLGERSSGKSHTLNRINERFDNVKYIEQFSLLERDEQSDVDQFNKLLSHGQSLTTEDYLKEFRAVVDDMANVDLEQNERRVESYLRSLKHNAEENEKADLYSKTKLYGEGDFPDARLDGLKSLVNAVTTIVENSEHRNIVEQYVSVETLKSLAVRLMNEFTDHEETAQKKRWLNDLMVSIRRALKLHTSAPEIEDLDFYQIALDRVKAAKLVQVAQDVRRNRVIVQKDIQGFQMVATTRGFAGAGELRSESGKRQISFRDAFAAYDDPYEYLRELRQIEALGESEYYRYFTKIEYSILNKHGFKVSGGERSEFRLLQEISDAQQFDMLLIDEPESSFDNLFLRNEVNQLIRDISQTVPVVIVTHNSTVGASIRPDYVVYTCRTIDEGQVHYHHYSGYPSDKHLSSPDGGQMRNFDVLINCLEAGTDAYNERGHTYEILKD